MTFPDDYTIFTLVAECDELDIDEEISNIKLINDEQNNEINNLKNKVDVNNDNVRNWRIFI